MGILDVGSGAAEGLETLLARMRAEELMALQQRQQTERERATLSEEGYRDRSLDETSKLRLLQQESLDESRRQLAGDRNIDNIRSTISMRPIGSEVSPIEHMRELGAGAPSSLYEQQSAPSRESVGMGVPPALAPNDPELSVIKFRGTQAQQTGEERIRLAEERAAAAEAGRQTSLGIAGHREERLTGWGPPTITIADPNDPSRNIVTGRNNLPAEGARGPVGAVAQEKIRAYENVLETITEIERFTPEEIAAALGPWDATVGAWTYGMTGKNLVGGGGDTGEALRTMMERLRAMSSFAEGGKNFTATESQLINSFMASVRRDPAQAKVRLEEFKAHAMRSLQQLGAGGSAPTSTPDDPYQRYLKRNPGAANVRPPQ